MSTIQIIPSGLCIKPPEKFVVFNYNIKNYDFILDSVLLDKIHSIKKIFNNTLKNKINKQKNNKTKKLIL